MARPLVIYDRDCAFCRRWVGRWRERTGSRVRYAPLQNPFVLLLAGISRRRARRSLQLVEGDGRRSQGAEAVFRLVRSMPGRRAIGTLALLPGVRHLAELAYRGIARHRRLAARADALLFGRSLDPPHYRLVRWAFLRGLGLTYLVAFTSLRRQVRGLYGRNGIVPLEHDLAAYRTHYGKAAWKHVPTLLWFDASDRGLERACRAGQVSSLALTLNVAPLPAALASWALYLSFESAGREFLRYQWDRLLVETGAHALCVAPGGLRPGLGRDEPAWHSVLLLRWLAFRFFFEAGLAKWQSGDRWWRECTACRIHYETQPLPNRLAFHAHQLPPWFHRFATASALGIELAGPFLTWGPRRVRRSGSGLQLFLQALIAGTGNYGFFNLLSAFLALWIGDDAPLEKLARRRIGRGRRPGRLSRWWRVPLELALAGMGAVELYARLRPLPLRAAKVLRKTLPFGFPGSYGLFAMMTPPPRPEIAVEGSEDGVHWREYAFRHKPGSTMRAPTQVAPFHPRLDWQLWFAALGPAPEWFLAFVVRLLQGTPEVRGLLARDPFEGRPPKYVRALLYEYRMTDRPTRRQTGAWWERELKGLYFPPVRLPRTDETAAIPGT